MVNDAATAPAEAPDRQLALAHAAADRRAGLAALLALDDRLAAILRSTREPMVGQMRLTWWHAALTALDSAEAPAEPVLRALAAEVLPRGVTGARLAGTIDGWEALLDAEAPDAQAMACFAAARGGGLFAAAATVLGADAATDRAGEAWALADLAGNLSDPTARTAARDLAEARFAGAFARRWPRTARPLGLLTIAAMLDLRGTGGIARAARFARHVLTGG